MTNPNLVRNGGFENSSIPNLPPFWQGTGSTVSGGSQLLGDNAAELNPGENIFQVLEPLQVGQVYQFEAAFTIVSSPGGGTVDVIIDGNSTRKFQANNIEDFEYVYYSFDFIPTIATPTLTIQNNSTSGILFIDVVRVKLTNLNSVRNAGFEMSSVPNLPPIWQGTGSTVSGGSQLLGDNAVALDPGENIFQVLEPLQVGQVYQFKTAFLNNALSDGTIDVIIDGTSTRKFQADEIASGYAYYSFDFIPTIATPTLTIQNNSTSGILFIDVVRVKLTNLNSVRNAGFEMSSVPNLPPFWQGSGQTENDGFQLLGDNAVVLDPGENMFQVLKPLQVGQVYQFNASFSTGSLSGTVDVIIDGNSTWRFQAGRITSPYTFYSFDFKPTIETPTLTIANNTSGDVRIDVVSVKLA
ncbi:hypothetical protein [Peribacillus frigoritolerans]|uniref:hypothetical protein n=1 Tax=Peribacillus frigoritolerans TaxID=450367 RepID=UPI00119BE3C5|nr:hypothetical protein [Peribacillus frigoritolerans]MDG4850161.1 hypothetical protein [Peribacillus frigoritolerans]TWE00635.1 hypothetical protein FB545_2975 [Peribacillus frigoritolerans]